MYSSPWWTEINHCYVPLWIQGWSSNTTDSVSNVVELALWESIKINHNLNLMWWQTSKGVSILGFKPIKMRDLPPPTLLPLICFNHQVEIYWKFCHHMKFQLWFVPGWCSQCKKRRYWCWWYLSQWVKSQDHFWVSVSIHIVFCLVWLSEWQTFLPDVAERSTRQGA